MMEEKSLGWYILFVLREGLYRVFRYLLSWRLLVVLAAIGYELLMAYPFRDREISSPYEIVNITGVTLIWLYAIFPFRMGRLFYLIPLSASDRKKYAIGLMVRFFVYGIVYYCVLGVMVFYLADVPISVLLDLLWLRAIPSTLLMSTTMMNAAVRKNPCSLGATFFSTRGWYHASGAELAQDIKREAKQSAVDREPISKEQKREKRKSAIRITVFVLTIFYVTLFQTFTLWLFRTSFVVHVCLSILAYVGTAFCVISYVKATMKEVVGGEAMRRREESECSL